MTIKEVEEAIQKIKDKRYDNEVAHILEDDLYENVLKIIANGCENAKEIAQAALKTKEVEFERWHA